MCYAAFECITNYALYIMNTVTNIETLTMVRDYRWCIDSGCSDDCSSFFGHKLNAQVQCTVIGRKELCERELVVYTKIDKSSHRKLLVYVIIVCLL